ncbi:dTDP-4-dehydrorhamnose reductase [Sphingobacterium hotanense]|uniref:dTDP-4-dehydrorhamnose reductase n=1 Tax=Sphingobacterium hotanense TaxID=649196 RepID=A0ABT7NL97_9SPHI|nr:dTDP-4-dehydrorhamnose reductase [Sphingobacterium hotanense]MDM1047926.1 dTDP-4-dehydrorhamnose reductase [Sphingobacterium hotanense]
MEEFIKPTVLLIGSKGQLGSELKALLAESDKYNSIYVDRTLFPLEELEHIQERLSRFSPQFIINAAAYTAVDKAEEEFELANLINHLAVKEMAIYAERASCHLISISTDYVFDGHNTSPWKEDDPVNPINVYGKTKALGEKAIIQENPNAIIIRTSWVYSSYGSNFVKTMLRLMASKEELSIVDDQVGSPTYAKDLALGIISMLDSKIWVPGIYHYANEGHLSWFYFAAAIKEELKFDCILKPVPSSAYKTAAERPKYSVLDKSKIKSTFGIQIPHWETSLKNMLADWTSKTGL